MKVSLVENSVMNLETDYVRFYNHPILDKEMASYTRLINDNGRVLFEKGESDDFVDAFNMCNDAIRDVKLITDVMANAIIEGRQGESLDADYAEENEANSEAEVETSEESMEEIAASEEE